MCYVHTKVCIVIYYFYYKIALYYCVAKMAATVVNSVSLISDWVNRVFTVIMVYVLIIFTFQLLPYIYISWPTYSTVPNYLLRNSTIMCAVGKYRTRFNIIDHILRILHVMCYFFIILLIFSVAILTEIIKLYLVILNYQKVLFCCVLILVYAVKHFVDLISLRSQRSQSIWYRYYLHAM